MNEQGDTFRKTYSLSEIGELIGRPATTVTTWKNQFREFLPSVGSGRISVIQRSLLISFS